MNGVKASASLRLFLIENMHIRNLFVYTEFAIYEYFTETHFINQTTL